MSRSRRKRDGNTRPYRIAVLVSGGGTTLQNLLDRVAAGRLPQIEIALVISSRSNVNAVARAEEADLPLEVIRVKDFPEVEKFSDQISLSLDIYSVDLVVQAGWLCLWLPPPRWLGKVINIHPSLLPLYGGKGFYGRHVHEAVLAAGDQESGATVQWVNHEYDKGEIVLQDRCQVEPEDTPETLAARVQAVERDLLPLAITRIREGEIRHPR